MARPGTLSATCPPRTPLPPGGPGTVASVRSTVGRPGRRSLGAPRVTGQGTSLLDWKRVFRAACRAACRVLLSAGHQEGRVPWCLTRKGRSACAKPHAVAGNGQLGGTAMACPGGRGGEGVRGVEGTHAVSGPSGAASPPQTTSNTGATPSVPWPPSHRRLPSPDCE